MKLPACPATICNDLPGAVRARRLDEPTSLTRLLRSEPEGHDDLIEPEFFRDIGRQALVDYSWPGWNDAPNLFPLLYTDASLVAAAYPVRLGELRALLPASRRLTPVRVTPMHGALMLYACDVRRSGVGAHRLLGVAVPVLLDGARHLPLLPLVRDWLRPSRHPALGFFTLTLAVDRLRATEALARLYGLPTLLAQAEFALGRESGLATVGDPREHMASLEVGAPRRFAARLLDLSFTRFSLLDGRILRTRHAVLAEGYRGARGHAKVEFGAHARFAALRGLRLAGRPLETRVCARLNAIAGGPEDLGPA